MTPQDRIGHLLSDELLSDLRSTHPLRDALPSPDVHKHEMWMRAGEQRLISYLAAKLAQAQQDSNVSVSQVST
jgi:hypothetical protein